MGDVPLPFARRPSIMIITTAVLLVALTAAVVYVAPPGMLLWPLPAVQTTPTSAATTATFRAGLVARGPAAEAAASGGSPHLTTSPSSREWPLLQVLSLCVGVTLGVPLVLVAVVAKAFGLKVSAVGSDSWAAAALTATDAKMPVHIECWPLNGREYPLKVFGTLPPKAQAVTVVIPGNPGQAEFYQPFCAGLQAKGCTPLALSYANFGDEPPPGGVLSIAEEAELKRLQLRRLVEDQRCRLRIAGHSIGAWITLQCLQDPVIRAATDEAHLLFPFVARNEQSTTQQFINFLLRSAIARGLSVGLVRCLCCLPVFLRRPLVGAATGNMSAAARELVLNTLLRRPFYVRSVLDMGLTEFIALEPSGRALETAASQVQQACDAGVQVYAMFAPRDHWGPLWHKEKLDALIHSPCYRSSVVESEHAYPVVLRDTSNVLAAWPATS